MSEKREIECAMKEVRFDDGEVLEGHEYVEVERHESGCGVSVTKCSRCGKYSVGWWLESERPL